MSNSYDSIYSGKLISNPCTGTDELVLINYYFEIKEIYLTQRPLAYTKKQVKQYNN